MRILQQFFVAILGVYAVQSAPVGNSDDRQGKNLAYFDYVQPESDYNYAVDADGDAEDDYVMAIDENDLSRALPNRKRLQTPPAAYNSPIYYIRLPPQPYMFVPGLGYVSQPPPSSPVSQFVNLPVSFVSNGKPNQIYQWSGGLSGFPTVAPPPLPPRPKPVKKPSIESTVHRLPGQFTFNGKPDDIFVLRDSYNSLYSDALQNFYP